MIPSITWGRNFSGLEVYLTYNRDHEILDLREVSSLQNASAEMALVAEQAPRAKAVVMHISLSAAVEDGELSDETWKHIIDDLLDEFGLHGHQLVAVRHRDKQYDHIHLMICTVSPLTLKTPPKQAFLAPHARHKGVASFALKKTEVEQLPVADVVWRSFNQFALFRLQDLCRAIEKRLELRQLRTHLDMEGVREVGPSRRTKAAHEHRRARTGERSLLERADDIRAALDLPSWHHAGRALAAIGVGFEAALRKSKKARAKIIGLTLYDLRSVNNRIKASDLDTAESRYGLLQIEKRRPADAITFERWWPQNTDYLRACPEMKVEEVRPDRTEFNLYRTQHFEARRLARLEREKLKRSHRAKRKAQSERLTKQRKEETARLPSSQRRSFSVAFTKNVRLPQLKALDDDFRTQIGKLRLPRLLSYALFMAQNVPEKSVVEHSDPVFYEMPAHKPSTKETVVERSAVAPLHTQPHAEPRVETDPDIDRQQAWIAQQSGRSR
ncbi:relaxase/mobilization nuclease domain-containing protein [Sphingobium sp. JS3065]|uniref:relaxase/mobilization nuclease domain-containing protein n=1 Tax=Sphingobium sp. JS3065 TaxID=2970925 RepID=UPI0022644B9F|nr:relaxase/mobilization nuclease domain-containing protein [Sphingobium sp. JS3065]UZW54836.1 relaxase/mobilization nuclease domain-containing protein [Sphingobium sp. JS3065]